MPSLDSVRTTVANMVENAVYPNGTSQPSVINVPVTVMEGFPIRTELDITVLAGNGFVSVFETNKERVITTFQRIFQPITQTAATLTATVNSTTVTIGGKVSIPQSLMVVVNGKGYGYQVLSNDTLNSIATNTAAMIPGASANNNVISIPSAYDLQARIATPYSAGEELSRVDREFMISCWTNNPTDRATLGAAIDVYMKMNYRVTLSDGFVGQVFYSHQNQIDSLEKSEIYRMDLFYIIQYPTTYIQSFTTITDPFANVEVVQTIQ